MTPPGKMVSVKWDAGEGPTVGADGKLVYGAEFTDIYYTEILDIPTSEADILDQAAYEALANHEAKQAEG